MSADLYAVGVTLFEALTGQLPFLGPDFVAQHLGEEPPAATTVAADVAPGWNPIIASLLGKDPDGRYESTDLLRRDIEAVDLGYAAEPQPLMLPRPRPRRRFAESATPPPPADAENRDAKPATTRYRFETALGRTEISQLSRALDPVLDRSVIIERYDEGAVTPAVERRMYALARGGGPFLQRALAYDRQSGVAVYEAPSGTPIGDVYADESATPRVAVRLLKRLARAVASLHEMGNAHGSLEDTKVLVDEAGIPTVLVCGLGPADDGASPQLDVEAIAQLVAKALDVERPSGRVGELLGALAPGLGRAEREAVLAMGQPANGEELHAMADAIEIALLKTQPK